MARKNSGFYNGSIIPACSSLASANLWPGRRFARIGCSPDETCGAREGAMKCAKNYSCNALYACQFEHRISNTECRMSNECVLSLAHPVNCLHGSIMGRKNSVSIWLNNSSMFHPGLSQLVFLPYPTTCRLLSPKTLQFRKSQTRG